MTVVHNVSPAFERFLVGYQFVFQGLRHVFLPRSLIHHDVEHGLLLRQGHVGQRSESGQFIHHTVAVHIDVDGARLLHRIRRRSGRGQAVTRHRFHALRILLHEVEVDRRSAHFLPHLEAVAAVAVKAVEEPFLHLFRKQRRIGTVTARSQNHGLRVKRHPAAVRERRFDARDVALGVRHEFLRTGIGHDDAAAFSKLGAHQFEEIDAAARHAQLTARGVIRVLRRRGAVRNLKVINQPIHNAARLLRGHHREGLVVLVLAGLQNILVRELRAVLRFLHDFTLIARTRGDQRTGVQLRVAADRRHLFNQNDLRAFARRTHGRRQPRGTAADDEHVGRHRIGNHRRVVLRLVVLRVGFRIAARVVNRVRDRSTNAV